MKIKKIDRDGQVFYEIAKEDLNKLREILMKEIEKIRIEERAKIKNHFADYITLSVGKYIEESN